MALLRILIMTALLILPGLAAQAAPARPEAGMGVLFLRAFVPERVDELKSIPLYADPGLGRIAAVDWTRIPSLAPVVTPPAGVSVVAVHETRGEWLRIAYDDAGREGWIRRMRFWDYRPWDEILPGRTARLSIGLREALAQLRLAPSDTSDSLRRIMPDQEFRILFLLDDWARVASAEDAEGWLRWRDQDGRLLVVLESPVR